MSTAVHFRIRPARHATWRGALRRRRFVRRAVWLALGIVLGAAVTLALVERYVYSIERGGVTVRVDRWTGRTEQNFGAGWQPVDQ